MPLTESQTRYVNFYTDFAFKKLFGTEANKDLLLSFLNSRFEGQEHFCDITYLNTEHLGASAEIAKYTPQERQDYEESLKNFRDWYSCLKTEFKKGKVEGLEEGMAKGRDERSIEIARNLKDMGLPTDSIVSATGLTVEEINSL